MVFVVLMVIILCLPFYSAGFRGRTTSTGASSTTRRSSSAVVLLGAGLAWVLGMNKRYQGPIRQIEFDEGMGDRQASRQPGAGSPRRRPDATRRVARSVSAKARTAPRGPEARAATAGCSRSTSSAAEVEEGTIDTVVTAFTDMQGRLFGKRIVGEYFLDEVVEHGVEGCNYLLALDMEMDPVPGYEMANWEKGYGDFGIAPDIATLRRVPWLDRTALVLADVVNHDGSPVVASPRQVLIAQYERAREMGYTPLMASELEFYLYKESYAEAHEKDFRGLTPTIPYILDYHILATTIDEQYLGAIRRGMHAAGIPIEFSKGEAWYGQHEVNTRYADAVTSADRHTIYKNGVKEIAFLNGISATLHGEAVRGRHRQLLPRPHQPGRGRGRRQRLRRRRGGDRRLPPLPRRAARPHPRAGAVHRAGDQLLQALCGRELGPDLGLVGPRQPHLRLPDRRPRPVAAGRVPDPGRRRQPLPRASRRCSPRASTGSRTGPTPGRSSRGTPTRRGRRSHSRRRCARRSTSGRGASSRKSAFGEDVQTHYLNYGRTEQRLFDQVVTDYERRRMFERG